MKLCHRLILAPFFLSALLLAPAQAGFAEFPASNPPSALIQRAQGAIDFEVICSTSDTVPSKRPKPHS